MLELDGRELAEFWRRGVALQVDILAASAVLLLAAISALTLLNRLDKDQQRRLMAGYQAFNSSNRETLSARRSL